MNLKIEKVNRIKGILKIEAALRVFSYQTTNMYVHIAFRIKMTLQSPSTRTA